MIGRQFPTATDMAVLYPYIGISVIEDIVRQGVLNEYRRMRLTVVMNDTTLVVHQILDCQGRRNHLAVSSEMIELTAGQWQNGNAQSVQFCIGNDRV